MQPRVVLFGSLATLALGAALLAVLHAPRATRASAITHGPSGTTGSTASAPAPLQPARVVSVGAALTEIAYALDAGDQLVAVDDGSLFPPEARALPRLGYQRSLSAEGLLALAPDLVLATPDAGPPAVLAQLRDAGVAVHVVPAALTLEGVEARITAVAQALDRGAQAKGLLVALHADVARAQAHLAALASARPGDAATPPRVLCLYARTRGTLQVCGSGTALDAMVQLAGGRNAIEHLSGSVPLGGESAVAAAPDVILLPRGSADLSGGTDALLAEAGLALTPAGRHGRVVVMDDLLLTSFGPRTGQALDELVQALHDPAPHLPTGAAPGVR